MKKGYIKDVPSQLPSTLLRYILEEPPQSILWRMTLTQLNACNNITTEQFLMFFLIWGDGLTSSRSLRKSSSTPTEMMLFMIVDEKHMGLKRHSQWSLRHILPIASIENSSSRSRSVIFWKWFSNWKHREGSKTPRSYDIFGFRFTLTGAILLMVSVVALNTHSWKWSQMHERKHTSSRWAAFASMGRMGNFFGSERLFNSK